MSSVQATAELLAEIRALRTSLLDANDLCRSAFHVANRVATELGTHALQSNFGALADRLHESLQRQHKVLMDTGGYAHAEEQSAPSFQEGWLRAIDEALVVTHLGVANAGDSYEDAKRKLNELICWHVDVAADPAVNGGFKLVPADEQPVPRVSTSVITDYLVSISAHIAQQDDSKAQAEIGELLKMLAAAPSVPDVWLPVPEKHPTFDPVDLQLSDGSVLCGCVPQSDGDYWWEGPSGEVFIDPKYASVTHWRLAAAPEAKPVPSVPDGWLERGLTELENIRNRLDDSTLMNDKTLIERLFIAMTTTPEAKE